MNAPTLPRQRTQQAFCPHCERRVPGLLAACNDPTCVAAEIDAVVCEERGFDDVDD